MDRDYSTDFRQHYQSDFSSSGHRYEEYEPAYDFGYRMAADPRYRNRNWADVETDLKSEYLRVRPDSTWDRIKNAVHYGWDRVTGR